MSNQVLEEVRRLITYGTLNQAANYLRAQAIHFDNHGLPSTDLWLELAKLYRLLKQRRLARDAYLAAVHRNIKDGVFSKAVKLLEQFINDNPKDEEGYKLIIKTFSLMGLIDQVQEYQEKLTAVATENQEKKNEDLSVVTIARLIKKARQGDKPAIALLKEVKKQITEALQTPKKKKSKK